MKLKHRAGNTWHRIYRKVMFGMPRGVARSPADDAAGTAIIQEALEAVRLAERQRCLKQIRAVSSDRCRHGNSHQDHVAGLDSFRNEIIRRIEATQEEDS